MGPGGETLQVGLSRPPVVHSNQMWRWIHEVEDMEKSGGGEERRASRMSGEGLGLGLERVRKNKMIPRQGVEH